MTEVETAVTEGPEMPPFDALLDMITEEVSTGPNLNKKLIKMKCLLTTGERGYAWADNVDGIDGYYFTEYPKFDTVYRIVHPDCIYIPMIAIKKTIPGSFCSEAARAPLPPEWVTMYKTLRPPLDA